MGTDREMELSQPEMKWQNTLENGTTGIEKAGAR